MKERSRRIDETGKLYGKLRVVRLNDQKSGQAGSYYDCKCECGTTVTVRAVLLRKDKKTSCGCDKPVPGEKEVGRHYGKWLVLGVSNRVKKNGEIYLDCRCECGVERSVLRASLVTDYSRSCGCNREHLKAKKIFQDLTGKRFGGLLIQERNLARRDGKTWWNCICDCGKKIEARSDKLVGPPYVTSCGCRLAPNEEGNIYGKLTVIGPSELRGGELFWPCLCVCGKRALKRGVDLRNAHVKACSKGCLNLDRYFETGINELVRRYQQSAQKRGLEYALARVELERLVMLPCAYCGCPPSNKLNTLRTKKLKFKYSGIDRIDSSKGYVIGNVSPCCDACNTAKASMGVEQFFEWVSRVYRFTRERHPDVNMGIVSHLS